MEPSIEASASPPATPSHHSNNDDLDPASFLKSIRELTERREREDIERYRKLEEEVEKSRAERARRKAGAGASSNVYGASFTGESDQHPRFPERTPSISPQKADSTNSLPWLRSARAGSTSIAPPPPLSPTAAHPITAMEDSQPQPPSPTKDIPEFKGFSSVRKSNAPSTTSTAQATDSATRPAPSASSLARSGTLTWQQRRPTSRGGTRPTSVIGSEDSGHGRNASLDQAEPSRDQIAASLGSRDPAWFRQTADRGTGSAAYRKSKDEAPAGPSFASGRRGLPGVSRETSTDPMRKASPAPTESVTSETVTLPASARDSGIASSRESATPSRSTPSKPDLRSLMAEDEAQREALPMSDRTSSTGGEKGLSRNLSMSSSQARLAGAIERPSSPTKGMGGFVQSAMMKRSDSVSKRWSAQPRPSLSRQNSTMSTRSGYGGLQGSHSMPRLEPTSSSREASNEPASRPTSSSSNLTAITQHKEADDGFVRPALPHHSRSKSVASAYGTTAEDGATSPQSSPSKRFSPTKSSWIESALTKPESPKPNATRNSQPSWMANIAKAKAGRASAESTPRTGTPKPAEELSRPSSPVKTTSFGPSMLRRSESRDLASTPRSSTPPALVKTPGLTGTPIPKRNGTSPSASTKAAGDNDKTLAPSSETQTTEQHSGTAKDSTESMAKPDESSARSVTSPPVPMAAKPKVDLPASRSITSPSPLVSVKPKPETPAKPQTDFRSTLRSRPAGETKAQGAAEFLSKFGNLRKTQPEKYVAPDLLKDNITRGKAELAKTGGPVKTPRRDELKESLLARKEDWKKAKEEGRELPGQVHQRKTSGVPLTPSKPEALAKRELLGRQDAVRIAVDPEKQKEATPEALSRQRSLKNDSKPDSAPLKQTSIPVPEQAKFENLSKQQSAPGVMEHTQATETSRLAARFNPGLAGILARGPPSAGASNAPSRSESPAIPRQSATSPMNSPNEAPAAGPLQDMRKGRAKGPKKRKGGAATTSSDEIVVEQVSTPFLQETESGKDVEPPLSVPAFKPRAPPGSAASLMMASLKKSPVPQPAELASQKPAALSRPTGSSDPDEKRDSQEPMTPAKSSAFSNEIGKRAPQKPMTPAKSPAIAPNHAETPKAAAKSDVPDFGGFKSTTRAAPTPKAEDNKENSDETLPSVKSAASFWGRQPSTKNADAPPQIQLPSRRDEEAALRSAGLLATSHSRPGSSNGSSNGLGITVEKRNGSLATPPSSAGLPPKPAKPSRVVSGQLQEASPNKGASSLTPSSQASTEAERLLARAFGAVPKSEVTSAIDVRAVIGETTRTPAEDLKTLRRSTNEVLPDGTLKGLAQHEEYTVYDESVYLCSHAYISNSGAKKLQLFVWSGASASQSAVEHTQATGKKLAREGGSLPVQTIAQGHEGTPFLRAIGGILVTRRSSRVGAPKQFMLCGRKHLCHITFDEVDFDVRSLCSGFVYLISFPVTLQQTKLYLWKGSACSTEEISAARLAAMDLSETGETIEVDDGAEFASFLKLFGPGTTKASIAGNKASSSGLWRQKAAAPDRFSVRLFRVQEAEQKVGLFACMFSRRPSWNSRPPSQSSSRDSPDVKVEVKHISPFTQADLEAEGVYILDAYSQLYVLIGPLFTSLAETARTALLVQALLFAAEYTRLCVAADGSSEGGRVEVMKSYVLFSGVPEDLRLLFRHWDQGRGLWGTAGLMAGSRGPNGNEVEMLGLDEVVKTVCQC